MQLDELPCFVLTIDPGDGLRRRNAENQLTGAGLRVRFVNGFHADDPGILEHYSAPLNLLAYRRSLSHGEIAVYCGHRLMWQKLLESGHSHALLLEDDHEIVDQAGFRQALADALQHPRGWDILKFYDIGAKRIIRSSSIGRTRLAAFKYPSNGLQAYLVSRDAAARLLSRKKIFRPVDDDISWNWEFGLSVWSVTPNPVREASNLLGGSLLEDDRHVARRKRSLPRSVWGNCLQAYKQIRSLGQRRLLTGSPARDAHPSLR